MAKARCRSCGMPKGRTQVYASQVRFPVGYPRSGVICGREKCPNVALVWLNVEEERAYALGQRIFQMDTAAAKVEVV